MTKEFGQSILADRTVHCRLLAMYALNKSEMRHRVEYSAKRVGNLCNRIYLPVEGGATKAYGKGKLLVYLGFLTGSH